MTSILPLPTPEQLLRVIQTLTDIMSRGLELEWVMTKVTERAQEMAQGTGAVVELLDTDKDEMVYRAVSGSAVGSMGLRLARSTSLSGVCVDTANVLYCRDSESDPRVNISACKKVGLRSMICVPLIHGEKAIGVLKVLSNHPNAFTDSDLCILQLMAEAISAAVYHADKFSQTTLFKQANTDSLTGLSNRTSFLEYLRLLLYRATRESLLVGVLMIDMDGLKSINDQYGHAYGDIAIIEIAKRISSICRPHDMVARLGGDEFAVVCTGQKTVPDLHKIAHRIMKHCDCTLTVQDRNLKLGASVGLAIYPLDGLTAEILLDKADGIMYDLKRKHKLRINPDAQKVQISKSI